MKDITFNLRFVTDPVALMYGSKPDLESIVRDNLFNDKNRAQLKMLISKVTNDPVVSEQLLGTFPSMFMSYISIDPETIDIDAEATKMIVDNGFIVYKAKFLFNFLQWQYGKSYSVSTMIPNEFDVSVTNYELGEQDSPWILSGLHKYINRNGIVDDVVDIHNITDLCFRPALQPLFYDEEYQDDELIGQSVEINGHMWTLVSPSCMLMDETIPIPDTLKTEKEIYDFIENELAKLSIDKNKTFGGGGMNDLSAQSWIVRHPYITFGDYMNNWTTATNSTSTYSWSMSTTSTSNSIFY